MRRQTVFARTPPFLLRCSSVRAPTPPHLPTNPLPLSACALFATCSEQGVNVCAQTKMVWGDFMHPCHGASVPLPPSFPGVIKEYAHPPKLSLTWYVPEPVLALDSDEHLVNMYSTRLNFFDVCPAPAPPQSMSLTLPVCKIDTTVSRKSTRCSRCARSCSVPRLLGPLQWRHLGAHKSTVIVCLDILRACMVSK